MRKINATLLNENNKEEAILKIKDDSFVVTTSNNLIKISHSDVKSYNYNDNNEILTITKFGGSSISLGIKKDKDLLAQLDYLVNKNKTITDEIVNKKIENNNLKTENITNEIVSKKIENNNLKTENVNAYENKKSNTGLIVIIGVVIFFAAMIWFLNMDFSEDNTTNSKMTLDNFNITNTCWENTKGNTIYCFDNKTAYNVKKIGTNYRATKYIEDILSIIPETNISGKLYYTSTNDTMEYEITLDGDNFKFLEIYDGDTVEYNLISLKTNDLNFTEPKINLSVLGNNFTIDYPNTSPMLIMSTLNKNNLTIKDKNGNITNYQGYKFKVYGTKLIYMKENEYLTAMEVGATSVLEEHTLCYQINGGSKQSNIFDINETLDYSITDVYIHYCNNM